MNSIFGNVIAIAAFAVVAAVVSTFFGDMITDMWTQATDQMALVNMVFGA